MRQEQIVKKPQRRVTRQVDTGPVNIHRQAPDMSDTDDILAEIEQLLGVV